MKIGLLHSLHSVPSSNRDSLYHQSVLICSLLSAEKEDQLSRSDALSAQLWGISLYLQSTRQTPVFFPMLCNRLKHERFPLRLWRPRKEYVSERASCLFLVSPNQYQTALLIYRDQGRVKAIERRSPTRENGTTPHRGDIRRPTKAWRLQENRPHRARPGIWPQQHTPTSSCACDRT